MTRNFRDKFDALPAKRRAKIERGYEDKLQDIQLAELRELMEVTQQELAGRLKVSQAAISKMEKQKRVNIVTLRNAVEAMGLELEISVKIPKKGKRHRLAAFSSQSLEAT